MLAFGKEEDNPGSCAGHVRGSGAATTSFAMVVRRLPVAVVNNNRYVMIGSRRTNNSRGTKGTSGIVAVLSLPSLCMSPQAVVFAYFSTLAELGK